MVSHNAKDFVEELDFVFNNLEDPLFLYHTDVCGVVSQAVINHAYPLGKGIQPAYSYITYEKKEKPMSLVENHRYKEIVFIDYEPHEDELDFFLRKTDEVVVIGHHNRQDLPDDVLYLEASKTFDGPKGSIVLYPLSLWAIEKLEENNIQQSRLEQLLQLTRIGLVAYGFSEIADEIAPIKVSDINKIIKSIKLNIEYRYERSQDVVERLSRFPPDYRSIVKSAYPLNSIFDVLFDNAIKSLSWHGKVVSFTVEPIGKKYFEQSQSIMFNMRVLLDKMYKYLSDAREKPEVFVCLHRPYNRWLTKVSIRSSDDEIDLVEVLEEACMGLTNNFGGHKSSAGAVVEREKDEELLQAIIHSLQQRMV